MDTDLQRRAERRGSSEKLRWHPESSRAGRRSDPGTGQDCGEWSGAMGTPWCPVKGVCPDVHGCHTQESNQRWGSHTLTPNSRSTQPWGTAGWGDCGLWDLCEEPKLFHLVKELHFVKIPGKPT